MERTITCIECPAGCSLRVVSEGSRLIEVTGNKCEKGKKYGEKEVFDPRRVLTSTVRTEGLQLKRIPVRTKEPIPKNMQAKAMSEVMHIVVKKPIKAGETIIKDIAGTGVDLVATRTCLS